MACARSSLCCLAWLLGWALPLAALSADADTPTTLANPATAQELKQIVVIGNAPLPGLSLIHI